METALGWLGDIFRFLLSLIPRIIIVRATEGGVKFVHGWKIVVLKPGLHLYWPLVTEVDVVQVKRQTVDLVPQCLTTLDGICISVSGILIYEITDVKKLLTECMDYDKTIQDHCLAAIKYVVCRNTFKFLQTSQIETDKMLTAQLRHMLRRFGVKTIRITLGDFTCFIAHGNLQEARHVR